MRRLPGRSIISDLAINKLPTHKTNGEQTNKQTEVMWF